MSFASTVSRVIDVPPTQSSGVALIWPAWTDAISSSVDSKSVPPRAAMQRLVGLGIAPADAAMTPRRRRSRGRPTTVGIATAAAPRARARCPSPTLVSAEHDDDRRRADGRHQDERDDQAAEDRAGRVRRQEQPPGRGPARARSSRSSADAVGNAMPEHDRHRQDHEDRRAEQRSERLEGLPGSSVGAATITSDEPDDGEHRDSELASLPAGGSGR